MYIAKANICFKIKKVKYFFVQMCLLLQNKPFYKINIDNKNLDLPTFFVLNKSVFIMYFQRFILYICLKNEIKIYLIMIPMK